MIGDKRETRLHALCDPALEYVAFDLETTGLSVHADRVVEIGAVRFDRSGKVVDQFEQLINPDQPMPPAAQAVHGISDADLAGAPPPSEVLLRFLNFLGNAHRTVLVAHNAGLDAGFLGSELRRAGYSHPGHDVFDTLSLARSRRPDLSSHRLDHLVRALGLDGGSMHRALADAFCVKVLWLALDGPDTPGESLVAYPIHDPREGIAPPKGWNLLEQAISTGRSVNISYEGGTHGISPRSITPRGFVHKGGVAYLVAYCHLGSREKAFRLDRIRRCEVPAAAKPADRHVDPETMNR